MKTVRLGWASALLMGVFAAAASAHEPRACCCPAGTCSDVSKPVCFDIGGDPQPDGTLCADITECPATWACDLPDGNCENKSFEHCDSMGGVWREGEVCDGTTCGGDVPGTCRVTGGGVDCFDGVFREGNCDGAIGQAKKQQGFDGYTFGGQAGAPGSAFGEWTHVQHTGPDGQWTFHAGTASAPPDTFAQVIACSDPPACDPAAANGLFKQIDFDGVGSFRNIIEDPNGVLGDAVARETLHPFAVHIEDLGEPGRNGRQGPDAGCPDTGHAGGLADCDCPDFYHITIWDPTGTTVIYDAFGYITGGNLQIHDALD